MAFASIYSGLTSDQNGAGISGAGISDAEIKDAEIMGAFEAIAVPSPEPPSRAGSDVSVRAAVPSDRARVVDTLAAAFQDDPVMSFIFPDARDRRFRLPRLFAILFDGDGAHGARWMSDGAEAGTLWRAPGQGDLGIFEKLRHGLPWLHAAGIALPRALTVSAASDANHPSEPHWYLHIVGCRPDAQGRGFGTAVIEPGLARADADGLPVYLETANATNLGFYRRLGFQVTHTWDVPGGPGHWSMLRPVGACA